MSDLRKAAEEAATQLEGLLNVYEYEEHEMPSHYPNPDSCDIALDSLREALEQPSQEEPFALAYRADGKGSYVLTTRVEDAHTIRESGCVVTKLYTHPQVELSDEDITKLFVDSKGIRFNEYPQLLTFARAIIKASRGE